MFLIYLAIFIIVLTCLLYVVCFIGVFIDTRKSSNDIDTNTSSREFEKSQVKTLIHQLNETADIINSTVNADVFFRRYEFALEICDRLEMYSDSGLLSGATPSQQKAELIKKLPNTINLFINNSYNRALTDTQKLKTERGKKNRMITYFDNLIFDLQKYGRQYITTVNVDCIQELLNYSAFDIADEIYSLENLKTIAKINNEN